MEKESVSILDSGWVCAHCEAENKANSRFCKNCGKPRFEIAQEFGQKSVYSVMALYFLLLIAILIISFTNIWDYGWKSELYVSLILAGITLLFVLFDPRDFLRYILPSKFRLKVIGIILLAAPAFSFFVTNSVTWLNRALGNEEISMFDTLSDAPNILLYGIIFTAVFPAVFEELAFRGVVFSRGKGIFSLKQSIWVSSILFTFLHLSFLSFIWILPFALALGYLRARYRTVFYGIIIHFLHNFTAVVLEYYHWDKFFF